MKSRFLSGAEAVIRYCDIPGPGRPLVFVHGLGCSSSSDYPAVAGHERLAGRRRILVDLLGSGLSDRPEGFSYEIGAHADSVSTLLATLSIPEVDLYGHSMGGSVAIMIAGRRPDLVSGLVLSEPNLDPGGGFFSRRIAGQSEAAYVEAGHEQMIREARDNGNKMWAATMAASSPVAVHRAARSLVKGTAPSWRQQLARLRMQRTVLFGERSLPDPDVETLPTYGVRVAVVPNAGHSMVWENPSAVAAAIADALP